MSGDQQAGLVLRVDPISGRETPSMVRCSCPAQEKRFHWYDCKRGLWLALNPPPRTICPQCEGRGSIAS